MSDDLPLACSLPEPELAARRQQVISSLFSAVQQMRELPDGYSLAFPSQAEWLTRLVEFIGFERECCPFFTFELRCEPDHGPIWLRILGPQGVKEMLRAELSLNIPLQPQPEMNT